MGCNESKQAVATTNAISRRSFRRKSSTVKPKDSDATAVPNENNLQAVPQAEQADQLNKTDQNNVVEAKDVNVPTIETKDKVEEPGYIVVAAHHRGVSMSSDYYSMRKDEDVASEDGYYSPTRDPVKDGEPLHDEGERKEGDQKEEVNKGDPEPEPEPEPVVQEEKSLAEDERAASPIKEDEKDTGNVEELKEPNLTKLVEEITVEPSETPVVVTGTALDLATAATETEPATTAAAPIAADESNSITKSEEQPSGSPGEEAETEAK